MSLSDAFVFTINNYTAADLELCRTIVDTYDKCTYILFGFEEAPSTGTPHLQGYIQLSSRVRSSTVGRKLGGRTRPQLARGSDLENHEYCIKSGEYEEYGERRSHQGRSSGGASNGLSAVMDTIKSGASMRDIASQHPTEFLKHHGGIQAAYKIFLKRPFTVRAGPWRWDVQVPTQESLHLWGAAGIGKTCYAQSLLPNALFVSHLDQLRGFDVNTYTGIIFDDMSFSHLPRESQIHLVDREQDRAIHIRYGVALIPAGVPKVFLSNGPDIFLVDPAISRRVIRINLV